MGGGSGANTTEGLLEHGGEWQQADVWPPEADRQEWFLHPGDRLTRQAPTEVAVTSYTVDPSDPAPSSTGVCYTTSRDPVEQAANVVERALAELAGHLAAARNVLEAGRVVEGARLLMERIGYREAAIALYPDRATGELRAKAVEAVLFALKDFVRKEPRGDLAEFLRRMSLDNEAERGEEERREGLNLMTLHSAKGLEFDTVYIPGLEEGILPHEKSIAEDDDEAVEEERRLLYVGMTRARRSLTFSFCASRARRGGEDEPERSRFFADIPPDLLVIGDPMEPDRVLAPDEGLTYFRRLRAARAAQSERSGGGG